MHCLSISEDNLNHEVLLVQLLFECTKKKVEKTKTGVIENAKDIFNQVNLLNFIHRWSKHTDTLCISICVSLDFSIVSYILSFYEH